MRGAETIGWLGWPKLGKERKMRAKQHEGGKARGGMEGLQ